MPGQCFLVYPSICFQARDTTRKMFKYLPKSWYQFLNVSFHLVPATPLNMDKIKTSLHAHKPHKIQWQSICFHIIRIYKTVVVFTELNSCTKPKLRFSAENQTKTNRFWISQNCHGPKIITNGGDTMKTTISVLFSLAEK